VRLTRFGEKKTAMKNMVVAKSTMAGPEGTSQNAEIKTPAIDVNIPIVAE
jgi:ribosomal protein S16